MSSIFSFPPCCFQFLSIYLRVKGGKINITVVREQISFCVLFSTQYYGINASHHKGFAMNQPTVGKVQVCFTSNGGELPFWAFRHYNYSGRFTHSVDNAEGYKDPETSYRSFIKAKLVWCWLTRLYCQLPPLVKTIMPIHLLKFQKHTICAWFSNSFT